MRPNLSVVIPVYNEEANLPQLLRRLMPSLDALNQSFEVIFTNDGSRDNSLRLLREACATFPQIKVIDFKANYGQHMAIIAAFEAARGDIIITLDADLQNPPEEIYKLLAKMNDGYDYVGSYRDKRQDNLFRTNISRVINWMREKITDIRMRDHGCMLRAYSREIIDKIVSGNEHSIYIPALAYKLSKNPTEVEVRHESRAAGESKYNLYMLVRLNFDLVTGFSIAPLQIFTMFGLGVCAASGCLVAYLLGRRLIMGPEAEGVFTLFAIVFFLISVVIFGIGLIGEYLGRLAQNLSPRARYDIRAIYGQNTLHTAQELPAHNESGDAQPSGQNELDNARSAKALKSPAESTSASAVKPAKAPKSTKALKPAKTSKPVKTPKSVKTKNESSPSK